jgi:hypothetical protein
LVDHVGANGADPGYRLRPDVVATVLDHGALLLDLESKYFYLLNTPGWSVVQLFEDGSTLSHVLARSEAWGASDVDRVGVTQMIDRMKADRLLEETSEPGNADGEAPAEWHPVSLERQAEPLQRVIVSAFDPSIPLAE